MASVRPSSLKASRTLEQSYFARVIGAPSCRRVAASHNRAVPSSPPVAIFAPSGLNATADTPRACPVRVPLPVRVAAVSTRLRASSVGAIRHAATASIEARPVSPVTSLCAASWRELASPRCRFASFAALTAVPAATRASTDSAASPDMTSRRRRVTRRASRVEAVTKLSTVAPGGGKLSGSRSQRGRLSWTASSRGPR